MGALCPVTCLTDPVNQKPFVPIVHTAHQLLHAVITIFFITGSDMQRFLSVVSNIITMQKHVFSVPRRF